MVPSPPSETDVIAMGIWIEGDEDLARFVDTFKLDLLDEQHDFIAQSCAQDVFDNALDADLPTPMDYVSRYWHAMSDDEHRAFLCDILEEGSTVQFHKTSH